MHSKGLRGWYIMAEGRRSQERGQRVGAAYTRQTPQFLPNMYARRPEANKLLNFPLIWFCAALLHLM